MGLVRLSSGGVYQTYLHTIESYVAKFEHHCPLVILQIDLFYHGIYYYHVVQQLS